jgi:hypothetical protein
MEDVLVTFGSVQTFFEKFTRLQTLFEKFTCS